MVIQCIKKEKREENYSCANEMTGFYLKWAKPFHRQ